MILLLWLLLLLLLLSSYCCTRTCRFQQLHAVCHLLSHRTGHCTGMLASLLLRTNENNSGTTRIHCFGSIGRYGSIDMILCGWHVQLMLLWSTLRNTNRRRG
uniref:Putative secreted protein n=1 Tax=Anopheles marajoara TaxID=58244 RepID=A0A2M4C9Q3_9DIPT